MKQTIITCDGCGKVGEPSAFGMLDVRPFRAEFIEGERGQGRNWRPAIEVDLCPACRDRFDELRKALDPSTWQRITREPMQQQEHEEPDLSVLDQMRVSRGLPAEGTEPLLPYGAYCPPIMRI